MSDKSVLVHSVRTLASLSLQDSLRSDREEIVCLESDLLACELIDARAVDLVIIDADGEVSRDLLSVASRARLPIVSLASRSDVALRLMRNHGIDNLLVCPNSSPGGLQVDVPDLLATKAKLLRGALFGLYHYVHGNPVTYKVADQRGTHRVAISIRDDLRVGRMDPQRASRIALLAHQIATSVLDGADRGALPACSPIEITCSTDPRSLGVSVRFGGMQREQLHSLVRYISGEDVCRPDTDEDFALPAAFSWCRSLVINACPGVETEIIGLVDPSPYASQSGASLHLCINDEPLHESVPNETVNLSDSMRVELRASASNGGYGAVQAISREEGSPVSVFDFSAVVGGVRTCESEPEGLKLALSYLSRRYEGAAVFAVTDWGVQVWGAAGQIAHPSELRHFAVRRYQPSTLSFLSREAALMRGRPSSDMDRNLAELITNRYDAYGVSVSVVVNGRVRYVLHGCDPALETDQAARELELLADELSRVFCRLERRAVAYQTEAV